MRSGILTLTLLLGAALLLTIPIVAQQAGNPVVYFYRDGQAVPVVRPVAPSGDPQADAETLLEALLAGPTADERAAGLMSPLPPGADLVAVTVDADEVTVDLDLPLDFLREQLDPFRSDAIVEQIVKTLHPLGLHHVHVRAEDESGTFLPVSAFLPRPDVPVPSVPPNDDAAPDRLGPAPDYTGQPPLPGQGQPQGALSGKTVWLSAGHGWYWSETLGRWNTQRPNTYGLVEDFSNAEAVNYYLARYLWNAGADVWLVRERSMIEQEVIVDNDEGAPAYIETGSWLTSSTPGYGGGTYRWTSAFEALSATATWTPDLPQAGWYAVWAWYRHGTNRLTDARYQIHHAGGVTTVRISQEIHGQTWRYLGEYYFQSGTAGRVTLLNASDDPGQAVIADAVRFGGGQGSIVEPGGASGEPRWEEAAKYWAQYQGAPPEVYDSDVTARPLYAEWETAKGYPGEAEKAVYVSWHTNAGGGTGTDSFVHDTEPTTGSLELQNWVHGELIYDLRHAWDPEWINRGQKSADFGELRELSTIPGVLLEVAFHDTEDPGDADELREPVFRQIAARAVYQGVVKYYADRQGVLVRLLPEPPTHLAAQNSAPGQVTLTWNPPPCCDGVLGDAATMYKVYHSADGRAFDDGTETVSPTLLLTGLEPGSLHFFRVTALNPGGESFPSPVVAARTPAAKAQRNVNFPLPQGRGASPLSPGGRHVVSASGRVGVRGDVLAEVPTFLLVDGFDRLDQSALIRQWESPALGTAQRMFLERMNRYDHAVEHGMALDACGLAFDGAVNEAVVSGALALVDYPAVDWFVGEDAVADASLNDAERVLLTAYLDGADTLAAGPGLLLSGSEIGYDLVENGRAPAFYQDYLRTEYLGDDAETYDFVGAPGNIFEGLAGSFDDSTHGAYDVDWPDRLAATAGSTVILSYLGGAGGGAAVVYD
ncbi:MAG: GerMN domain-containing protein, partial [Anaerolineae bacterium]